MLRFLSDGEVGRIGETTFAQMFVRHSSPVRQDVSKFEMDGGILGRDGKQRMIAGNIVEGRSVAFDVRINPRGVCITDRGQNEKTKIILGCTEPKALVEFHQRYVAYKPHIDVLSVEVVR